MSEKTKQIVTTVIGAVVVSVGTILSALQLPFAPVFIGVAGSINEAINILLEHFVRK